MFPFDTARAPGAHAGLEQGVLTMNLRMAAAAATFGMALLGAASASAITAYSDPTAFHALGPITQTTTWPGYPAATNTILGPTFVDGALKFSGDQLEVYGANYPTYLPQTNVLVNNLIGPIHGEVTQTGSNLLSFELANMTGMRDFTLSLYYFNGVSADFGIFGEGTIPASQGFQFYGFAVGAGQYFTGFKIESNNSNQDIAEDKATFVGISKVELGHTGSRIDPGCRDTSHPCTGGGVPEPSAWALMILGFGAVGASLRMTRRGRARTA
jgi:hypothetical protein